MAETYCMKSCTECAREGCPGCRAGAFEGQCEIRKCCRDTMHESCETCTNQSYCGKWRGREQMPEKAIYTKSRAEVQVEKTRVAADALAKWVKVIFWAMIASILVSLAALFEIRFPAVHWVVLAGDFVMTLVVCWGYYGLRNVNRGFHAVAGLQLACLVLSLLVDVFPDERPLEVILMIPVGVLGIIMFKRKCETFRDVLSDLSTDLYEKWDKQWSLYLISTCVIIGGLLFTLFMPILGLLAAIGGIGMLLFVTIREYVYLWQTAEACEYYRHR